MDQTTDAVEQDIKSIVATRAAIADKLKLLERRVEESFQSSREAIHRFVREGTIAMERAATIGNGARWIAKHAEERPWALVGAAIAFGFLAGRLAGRASRRVYPYYTPSAKGAGVMPEKGKAGETRTDGIYPYYPTGSVAGSPSAASGSPPTRQTVQTPFFVSLIEGLREEATAELGHMQTVLLQAGRKLLRDALRDLIPISTPHRPIEKGKPVAGR
ncbi:MAG TPA: hypothetical protein VLA99_02625 [Nitrospiraceae bacterium]|nr:hypothetical protein [Nitrospiraceae bacterium]